MDWTAYVDGYCERIAPGFWGEPINAITNFAFLIAAVVVWRRTGTDVAAKLLCIILFAIGIGSGLFHTLAQRWSGVADVVPIVIFILTYLYLASYRLWGLPMWAAALSVVLFFPYAYASGLVIQAVAGPLNGSVPYVSVALLIALYGLGLLFVKPDTGRGLLIGAAILAVSITFRSIDEALCTAWPIGTHFMWHVLNGIMLGWMIVVMLRHGPRQPKSATSQP